MERAMAQATRRRQETLSPERSDSILEVLDNIAIQLIANADGLHRMAERLYGEALTTAIPSISEPVEEIGIYGFLLAIHQLTRSTAEDLDRVMRLL